MSLRDTLRASATTSISSATAAAVLARAMACSMARPLTNPILVTPGLKSRIGTGTTRLVRLVRTIKRHPDPDAHRTDTVFQLPNIGSISGLVSQAGNWRSDLMTGAPSSPWLASFWTIRRETSTPSSLTVDATAVAVTKAANIAAAQRPMVFTPS